ncbi:hypothetical protein CBR_g602 [Chara braunii]|uniref:Ankyrin repeat domain-containing protein n=1 Tax=Chara braunii TaxID=69332 RepID=A0A388KBR6_CHABU|nr:hypothetical protein CBR_g602 [Chara braunii]|eukprot:GBG67467.1 hypothetical protein CBR_g602 [Chara braunii]
MRMIPLKNWKVDALLDSGVHPADCLILLASREGDVPKIKELMAAGADIYAKDLEGKNSLERAQDDNIRKLLLQLAEEQKNSPAMPQ